MGAFEWMGRDGSRSNGWFLGWMSCDRRKYGIIMEVRISYMDGEGGGIVTFRLLDWGAEVGMGSRTN